MSPLVSVIMAVYNRERYVKEAIESILNQTYHNLELIIVEDASTDKTLQIINLFSDDRIRLLCNEKNSGTLYSMQRAVGEARGEYIAVLDSDDISFPSRIEKQVLFMQTHKDVLLCAAKADYIINGKIKKNIYPQIGIMGEINFSLLFRNRYIVHSTVMFRRTELEKKNIKYEKFSYCHDYYLILNVAVVSQIYLIDEVLGLYRIHTQQKTYTLYDKQRQYDQEIKVRILCVKKIKGLKTEEKNILIRAIKGRIRTYREYRILEKALMHYIEICKLGNKSKNVIKSECTSMILQQKKCVKRLFFAMTSSLIDKRQFLNAINI